MAENSNIAWTTNTFNPWMGCQRISPACGGAKGEGGCYAEALVVGRMGYNLNATVEKKRLRVWGPPSNSSRVRFKAHHGADPAEWPEDLRVQEFPQ